MTLSFSKCGSNFVVTQLSISRGESSFDRGSGFKTPGLKYNKHGELATTQPFSIMPYRGRPKGTLIPEAELTQFGVHKISTEIEVRLKQTYQKIHKDDRDRQNEQSEHDIRQLWEGNIRDVCARHCSAAHHVTGQHIRVVHLTNHHHKYFNERQPDG